MFFRKPRKKPQDASPEVNILDRNVPTLHDLFVPDGIEEHSDMLTLGPSRYARTFVISLWPREIHVGWLEEIYSLGDVDVSVHIRPVPDRDVILALTRKIVDAQAQHSIETKRGSILHLPQLEQLIADLETIRRAIQNNQEKMFFCVAMINLHASSPEQLDEKTNTLCDILARKSTYARSLLFRQLEGMKSCLPVCNITIDDHWRNLTTGGVASMMPVATSDLSHTSGIWIGFNCSSQSPVFYNPYLRTSLPNPHILIVGNSGTGKTSLITVLMLRMAAIGVRSCAIDPENEFTLATSKAGGTVIKIKNGEFTGINPLEVDVEVDEDGTLRVPLLDKITDMKWLISVMVKGHGNRSLSPVELAIVEDSIREEYEALGITTDPDSLYDPNGKLPGGQFAAGPVKKPMPTLSSLVKRIGSKPGGEELALILRPFLRGGTLGMFDGQTSVDLVNAPIVDFAIREIRDEFTRLYCMFVILTWLWTKFCQKDRHLKMVPVDEAWRFMRYEDSAMYFSEIVRRGRKYNVSLVVSSQLLHEFINNEEGNSILGVCATSVLFQPHTTQTEITAEQFHLSEGARAFLETAGTGKCLFLLNRSISPVEVVLTPTEKAIIEEQKKINSGGGFELDAKAS
ncbi:VirB4 family type IV secretion system protein [Desulfofundulus thermocisternus]|uniref:VirB4 family type IV secretion system protein n=1 Tax=Desulfofundulus thermocisternus TaxID=42471 RepID=UPI00217CF7B8|nr:hypothetical protein [Desulfofundulus thermocisternus]MCS5696921.1 hypothetical protein [Desulfofundulus thermocisternus]